MIKTFMIKFHRALFLSLCFSSLSFQALAEAPAGNLSDPYENFNRSIFEFNMKFNDSVGRPSAEVYTKMIPPPVRSGIDNFFNNLTVPLSSVNSFLQGKGEDGFESIMRFAINSTFGLLGILDVATPAGLEDKKEDFGQTLYQWGLWEDTGYLVLPFVGSYTIRELAGNGVDSIYNPVYPYVIDTDLQGRVVLYLSGKFVDYTQIIKLIDDLKNQPDPYIFARESYFQYRNNLLYDGKPPTVALDDFNFDEM